MTGLAGARSEGGSVRAQNAHAPQAASAHAAAVSAASPELAAAAGPTAPGQPMHGQAVPCEQRCVLTPMIAATLSLDHRVIDGAMAARYLGTLKGMIEEPMRLLA